MGRVVDGGMVGLLVYSTVSWTPIPHHHMLVVGRICGYWGRVRLAGAFYWVLDIHSTGLSIRAGAY